MIKEVLHIGITVTDMEKSINFYKNILGMKFIGELFMKGEETDILFAKKNCEVRVAYLNGSDNIVAPPIELIQFLNEEDNKKSENDVPRLDKTSISEICFKVEDIDKTYEHLVKNNVECISKPQEFDFREFGFGKSKALYFKDPDGIILELIQNIN